MRLDPNLFDFRNFERFYLFDGGTFTKRGTPRDHPTLHQPTYLRDSSLDLRERRRSQSRIFALVSPILNFMEIAAKLEILADAAKYDASCASSGAVRKTMPGGIGNS